MLMSYLTLSHHSHVSHVSPVNCDSVATVCFWLAKLVNCDSVAFRKQHCFLLATLFLACFAKKMLLNPTNNLRSMPSSCSEEESTTKLGREDSTPKLEKSVLRQLADDIESAGGIQALEGLAKLLDYRSVVLNHPDCYGLRGTPRRRQISNKVDKWKRLSQHQYLVVLGNLGIQPFAERVAKKSPSSIGEVANPKKVSRGASKVASPRTPSSSTEIEESITSLKISSPDISIIMTTPTATTKSKGIFCAPVHLLLMNISNQLCIHEHFSQHVCLLS